MRTVTSSQVLNLRSPQKQGREPKRSQSWESYGTAQTVTAPLQNLWQETLPAKTVAIEFGFSSRTIRVH